MTLHPACAAIWFQRFRCCPIGANARAERHGHQCRRSQRQASREPLPAPASAQVKANTGIRRRRTDAQVVSRPRFALIAFPLAYVVPGNQHVRVDDRREEWKMPQESTRTGPKGYRRRLSFPVLHACACEGRGKLGHRTGRSPGACATFDSSADCNLR